jgi:flagellar biosynthesis protein FlhG
MPDDQAGGLRRLFGAAEPFVLSVAGKGVTPVALDLATALARIGRRVLVLDRSRGDAAAGCGLAARYELAHILAGAKQWGDVALQGPDGIVILPAARGLDALDRDGADWQAAVARLARGAGQAFDVWLVNGAPPRHGAVASVLLPIAPTAAAITDAYAQMKRLALERGQRDFRVLVHRAKSETAAFAAYRNVATAAERFLSARLDFCGCIPGDATQPRGVRRAIADARSARGHAFLRLAETLAATLAPAPAVS